MLLVLVAVSAGALSLAAQPLTLMPRDVRITSLVREQAGSLYAGGYAGEISRPQPFLVKLADDGSRIRMELSVRAPQGSRITALAVDAQGAIYVAGNAALTDRSQAFVQKFDSFGRLQYAVNLGGTASAYARSIAVNSSGEALVNGQAVRDDFPVTPGAPRGEGINSGFLVQLDVQGGVKTAIRGVGVGLVAYDEQNNLYVAGTGATIRPLAGAFQTTHRFNACGGSGFIGFGCGYQHIAKFSPDGKQLLYSTFVTGSHGATPAAMVVDRAGQVIVAGTTNSPDYPVTEGALQPEYRATATPSRGVTLRPPVIPPPASGYITKLKADGSDLVWSTYFSGTGADWITGLEATSDGGLLITGLTASRDLPLARRFPEGCTPVIGRQVPYVTRLSLDAAQVLGTRLIWELSGQGTVQVAKGSDRSFAAASGDGIALLSLDTEGPLACLTDPADSTLVSRIAPGQVLSIFSGGFDEDTSVSFGGQRAGILYSSPEQLNVQVPLEFEEDDRVRMEIASGERIISRMLPVVGSAPSAFLTSPPFGEIQPGASCKGRAFSVAYLPVARNDDSEFNTCEHPAAIGSVVAFFLNGVGAKRPIFSLRHPAVGEIESAEPDPGSPPGVWRLRVRLSPQFRSGTVEPLVDGQPLRFGHLAVWVSD